MEEAKFRTVQAHGQRQRGVRRCGALEPVLEHSEAPSGNAPQRSCGAQAGKRSRGKPVRILVKLRDGNVRLMNEVSFGEDLSGVSSFSACSGGDYPVVAMAGFRLAREEQEGEIILHALQLQLAHSRQFATAMA